MKFDFDSMTPGIRTLPSGSFTFSNSVHSCAWRGFAASNEIARRPRLEHDVDDVGERHVAVVRALVVAPAEVHAQLLGRDVRAAAWFSASTCSCALLAEARRDRQVGELDVAAHRQVGAVELQHEAGLGDRLVLVLHRVGDGVQVLLVASGSARCGRRATTTPGDAAVRNPCLPAVDASSAALQVIDVDCARLADRARRCAALHAGVLRRERPGSPKTRLREHRELREVLIRRACCLVPPKPLRRSFT